MLENKTVLVTGAAGTLGLQTIKYLLSEGKYNITALDLKNKKVFHNLKRYRKRVDVIYGDVLDRNLVEKLVKNADIIIHLASCLPPVCNYYKDIPNYTKSLIINYFSNQIFTFLFFVVKSPFIALIDTIIVLISSLFLYFNTKELDKKASVLLIPYIIWNIFATILITSIFFMNL